MTKDPNTRNKQTKVRIVDIAQLADVSPGTVDRVIHNRGGVSQKNKEKVERIIEKLNYRPNRYASALASNKHYVFYCLLPQHEKGGYWSDIEEGIQMALNSYTDFNVSTNIRYYNPYQYKSFIEQCKIITQQVPDGVIFNPSTLTHSIAFAKELNMKNIPFVYLDFNIEEVIPLAFFGQDSSQSGFFAAKMLMLLAQSNNTIVIFRQIDKGIIGSNQQKYREIGFRNYMQLNHTDCKILELDLNPNDSNENITLLNDFFKANPTINNGITFNSKVYIIGEYLEKINRLNFNLIGYDLLEKNVQCLKKGSVDFLIAQQPKIQGYNSVESLCNHLIFRQKVSPINYMPIDLLSKETIDYYKH